MMIMVVMLLLMFGFCTSVLECILCMYEVFFFFAFHVAFFVAGMSASAYISKHKIEFKKLKYTHIAHKKPASNKKRKRIKKRSGRNETI